MNLLQLVQLPSEQQAERGLLHTPREIAQQPESWQKTLDLFQRERVRISSFLERAGIRQAVEQRPSVFLVGAGTSDYIGHALALLLRQEWGCDVAACASTELLPNMDEYVVPGRKGLWISFSRSGNSPEGVAVLKQASEKYPEIAQLVVTCNARSQMVEICAQHPNATVIVLDDATNDRGLAMTSSFTNMVVMGQCLAHAWSIDRYVPLMQEIRAAGDELLVTGFSLAEKLAALRLPICMVGTGPLAAVAKESALKVLEMTAGKVKTMPETTLGLRHGPMAALDRDTLFVCFASGDQKRLGYSADLLREVGSKKVTAARIAVGLRSAEATLAACCEEYLPIEADIPDAYRPVVDVLFGQLLGLCSSIEHDLQPDAPSPGGVITRVVQEFAIYR